MKRVCLTLAALLSSLPGRPAMADPSPFDLAGPGIRISVTRQGVTLPIAAVPQLAAGDRVKVEAALPADESTHYLLVAAFLRDPTNPPPATWFQKSEAWKRAGRGGGPIELTVPANAQHLVLFLAPETGGDFKTLREAVQARPGAFVRASQDLEQASLDRSRYDAYLAAIRRISASQPEALAHLAPVVADSLHIKINEACLQRQPELQAPCLLDSKQSVVLGGDDKTSGTLSGSATDLALSLSATPAGGLGYFSPYISAIHEIVGIFGAMRTAKYQYIPALGAPRGDLLSLALNTPPSFANPKSVIVAALPAVKPAQPPVLHLAPGAVEPCFGAKSSDLSLASAPLLYATAYAHDLALRVHVPAGGDVDLPLTPDAAHGGLVVGQPLAMPPGLTGTVSGTVHGLWGFEPFTGPEVTLQSAGDWHWQQDALKGDGQLILTGAPASCVAAVTMTPAQGLARSLSWKANGPDGLAVTLPASGGKAEPLTLTIAGPQGTPPATVMVTPAKVVQPAARITAHSSEPVPAGGAINITLTSQDEIPADARLNVTLKARDKEHFSSHDIVEIATLNGDAPARLTFGSGLTLVDQGILVASLTPAQTLGLSAFGPLRARLLRGDVAGDWMNVGMLVRLPRLKALTCPTDPVAACTLRGEGLYLLASVSARQDFDGAVSVPEGYPGFDVAVPHPAADGTLFVRLHDAPEIVNRLRVVTATTP